MRDERTTVIPVVPGPEPVDGPALCLPGQAASVNEHTDIHKGRFLISGSRLRIGGADSPGTIDEGTAWIAPHHEGLEIPSDACMRYSQAACSAGSRSTDSPDSDMVPMAQHQRPYAAGSPSSY